jgi:hypothetical protein
MCQYFSTFYFRQCRPPFVVAMSWLAFVSRGEHR